MKVTGYETWVVRVPYEEVRAPAPQIILRLTTDEGLDGIAYVTPLVPWTIKPIRVAIEEFAQRVIGRTRWPPSPSTPVPGPHPAPPVRRPRPQRRRPRRYRPLGPQGEGARPAALAPARRLGQQGAHLRQLEPLVAVRHRDPGPARRRAVEQGFRAMKYRLGGVKTREESHAPARRRCAMPWAPTSTCSWT